MLYKKTHNKGEDQFNRCDRLDIPTIALDELFRIIAYAIIIALAINGLIAIIL